MKRERGEGERESGGGGGGGVGGVGTCTVTLFFILLDMAATLAMVISGRGIRSVSNSETPARTLFGYLCDRLVRDTRNSCPGPCEPK